MRTYLFSICTFIALILPMLSKAQQGANDPTFNPGDNGFGYGDGANSIVYTSAVQADGKIIVGGTFTNFYGTDKDNIARLNADGSNDLTFNSGNGTNGGAVWACAIQSDGKIIIGGDFTAYNGTARNRIARINTDGTIDATFNPGTGANNDIQTISIQSDGKIIIGGQFTTFNGTTINRIARIDANGAIDPTFVIGAGSDNIVYTSAIQSDGKIIIGGSFTNVNGVARTRVARINTDGSTDVTFTTGSGANNIVSSSAIQSDGKIIIGGAFTTYSATASNYIARLNTNGTLDGTFAIGTGANNGMGPIKFQSDGKIIITGAFTSFNGTARTRVARLNTDGTVDLTYTVGTGASGDIQTCALQADDKVFIGGAFTSYNGSVRTRIARINTDGSIDATFGYSTGANGIIRTSYILPNGKIAFGGDFSTYSASARSCITRANNDGTTDIGFNPGIGTNGGIVRTISMQSTGKLILGGDFNSYAAAASVRLARAQTNGNQDAVSFPVTSGPNNLVYTSLVQPDDKIIIAGVFTSYAGTARNHIARVLSNATNDGTFNPGTGTDGNIHTCAIQSDGNIIIGGTFTNYNGTARSNIARITTTGTLDATFNPGTGTDGIVYSCYVQSDGKIVIAGNFTTYNGTARNNIARLNADGSLDATFNPGAGTNNIIYTTCGQVDGKVIIGGNFTSYDGTARNYFARLNSNGTLDLTFNIGTGANNTIYASAIQSDGYIIIAGAFTSYNGIGRNRAARIIGECIAPSVTSTTAAARCGDGTVTLNATSNSGTINWYASPTSTISLGTGTSFTTPSISNNTTYYVEAGNTGCTSLTRTAVTATINSTPTITVNSGTVCSGQSFTITPSGASTYTIQGGSAIKTPTANATYTVIGSSTAGCVSSAFVTSSVTVNAKPVITVNSGSICSGNSFTINPSGANTYTIQGGSAIVTPTSNTSYTVVGTSTAGCVSNTFATSGVTVSATPTITVNSGSICAGNNFTITPSGASTYTIEGGGAVKTPTANTNYTVVGTSAAGCVSSTFATSSITVNAKPVISVNSGSICSGSSFTITPSGASTYTIQGGSAVKTPTANATYTVTGTSAAGCTSATFATSSITVNATPTITVNGGNICSGSSFTIVPSGASTYTFSSGSVVSPTVNTTYTVTGTTVNGCTNSIGSTLLVAVNPPITNLSVSASATNICSGQSATVSVASSQTDMKYYLRDDATNNVVVGPVNGTGGTLSFNTGTLTSNTTYNVYAESQSLGNKGLDFDGVNDVITTNITSATTSSLTIEAWIYPRATTVKRIVSSYFNNAAQSGEFILDTYNVTNNGRGLRLAVEGAGNTLHQLSIANVLTLNAWNHVAGTFSNGVTTLYVNGIAVATSTAPFTSIPSCTNTTTIGEDPTIGAAEYFNGKMDDIRIWTTARTQSEISGNMNNCLIGNESGLKNYFKFSENAGSTVTDLVTGAVGNMSGMTPATAWVTGNVDCGGSICNHEMTQLVTINVNATPTISVNSGSICSGNNFTITPSGASTYTIQGGGAVKTPTANTTYTVTGTSAAGCISSTFATSSVTVNTTPTISVNSGSICAGNNFTITPSGASTYTIQGGSAIKTPTATTTYTVAGTGTNGCVSSTFVTSTVTVNALPVISVPSTTICAGSTATLTASGANTYTWNTGANTSFITASPASNTTYTVNGTSSQGCLGNLVTASITVGSAPSIALNNASVCAGSSATLIASGVSSYTWNTGATTNSIVVSPTVNTTYSVSGNLVGCTNSASNVSNVTVNSLPTIAVNSGSICSGNSFTITPSGASTYTIQGGSAIKTPTANTTYTVIGTSSDGCVSSSFATSSITVNATPTIAVNSGSICAGSNFTITPSGANTYTIQGGNTIVTPTANATYTVAGTGTNGCVSNTFATANVTVNATPTITANSGSICEGESFTITPNGANTYTIQGGNAIVNPTANATYTVIGTSANGCISSSFATANVTVNAAPVIIVNSGSICEGESFTITPSGASTYTFSNSNIVNPLVSTNYTITGTGSNGCVNSIGSVSSVTVNSAPIITAANGAICIGNSYTLSPSGASTYTYSNGSAVVSPTSTSTYSISGTSAAGCVSNTPAIVTVTVSNTLNVVINGSNTICNGQTLNLTAGGAATYTWNTGATSSTIAPSPTTNTSYSVIGASGTCSNTAIISVTVNALPTINAVSNETLICVGETATLTANGASTYTWNPGGVGTTISVSPSVTTTYTVTGTDINGCENNSTVTQDVSLCTGINNITNNDNAMTLFPNPSSSNLSIQTIEDIQEVFIFNTLGDLVQTEKTKTFSIEQLSSGIYIIHVKTEKGMNSLRFVRE